MSPDNATTSSQPEDALIEAGNEEAMAQITASHCLTQNDDGTQSECTIGMGLAAFARQMFRYNAYILSRLRDRPKAKDTYTIRLPGGGSIEFPGRDLMRVVIVAAVVVLVAERYGLVPAWLRPAPTSSTVEAAPECDTATELAQEHLP